jgi:pimeloyl-ACP methyl ester carboxylesterase
MSRQAVGQWFTGDTLANGMKIHYHRTGGDKPALVLSHGSTGNGLFWTRVARALESDYDVIMYDQRGHGLSDAPPSGTVLPGAGRSARGCFRVRGGSARCTVNGAQRTVTPPSRVGLDIYADVDA